jgi:type VI protein secretion system component VasF
MDKQPTRRRRARRAAARTLATAAAVAALVATFGAGQALAGPDERVLERQGRIDRQATAAQADEQPKAEEPSQAPSAQYPRRYLRPEPPMDTGPRLDIDEPVAPTPPPPAQDRDRDGLAITLAVVALLLAVGAATTWRIYRRPRPEPTA